MKNLLLALLALSAPAAHAATLEIVNNSAQRADIGEWRGIKVPSICEDFKPCWVEVNQKFIPAPGLGDIRGEKTATIAPGSLIRLYVPGRLGTYEIIENCRQVNPADLSFYFQLNGEAHLKDVGFLSMCLVNDRARLVID
jgi:hypothetical protein